MAVGLLRPDDGHSSVFGVEVWKEPLRARRLMGVLPDGLAMPEQLTGRELLTYLGQLRGLDAETVSTRAEELLDVMELSGGPERTLVVDYSTGMRKKIGLATALLHGPRVLVLDEPFEAVDPVSAATLKRILNRFVAAGGSVLLSSHVMALVEQLCDTVAVMAKGVVVAEGPLAEVRGSRSLEEAFVDLVDVEVGGGEGVVVGVLIGMKLAVMRHSITGAKATWMLTGSIVGLAIAAGTIAIATLHFDEPAALMDLLAVVFAIWTFGWMLGPAFGGQPVLRPEHFALEPVSRGNLALGLLAAAFVGITTAITFVAFSAIVVFAARLDAIAVVVSIPALALQLALVVVLSRLAARMFGALARSRTGAAITAVITAVMMVLSQSCWVVLVALDSVLSSGFSREFSLAVRTLPSSWGVVAVEASARGDWALAAAGLAALAIVVAALVAVWSRLLGPQRLARPMVLGSIAERAAPSGWAARGAMAAVYVKELRTWLRDPLRVQSLVVAPVFAVLTGLLPLLFDSTAFLPFVGALTALMAAIACANLYGQDGTALWLTLLMPNPEEADVRGRQLAWLTLFGPMSLALTVAGAAMHGDPGLWPWALAATLSLLGGGAGLLLVVATDQSVPGPDPHKAKNSPLDHSDVTGQSFVMLFAAIATAAPALGAALAGELLDQPLLTWAAVPVALVSGVACYVLLGKVAAQGLRTRGPELLYLMRTGQEHEAQVGEGASVLDAMPGHRRRLLWTSFVVGCIALFPQALVPLGMKLSGNVERVWFLALYMPESLQWPTIAFMIVLALAAFGLAARIYLAEMKRTVRARAGRFPHDAPRLER